ncbi:hypothetical protein ACLBWP_03090 [Microbacterium sp. M1A1_1b]
MTAGVLLFVGLGVTGCATQQATPSPSPAPTGAAAKSAATPKVDVTTGSTSLGTVVVDGAGMTAYYFDADTKGSGTSACTDACATAWPAIESSSSTPSVSGVTGTVGTITGVDGKPQVTIDGRPIYTFVGDHRPGDVTGQGDKGVWYVVDPDGSEHK